jgi:uncharacterized membrane protein
MNLLPGGNALLALAAAILWGGGDFTGGMGVKRAGGSLGAGLRIVLLSHATSFIVLVAVARMREDAAPHGGLLGWGIAAGVAGGLSLTAFYIALSRGAMGASAAVSGLLAATIPAALTLWQVGPPGRSPLIGFAMAAIAIWLIAANPAEDAADAASRAVARQTMALAILAGVGFGFYFIALKMASPAGVIWPMASARIGSLAVCSLMLLGLKLRPAKTGEARLSLDLDRGVVVWALGTALLDTSGNLLFLAATRAAGCGRCAGVAVSGVHHPAGGACPGRVAHAPSGAGNGRRRARRRAHRNLAQR